MMRREARARPSQTAARHTSPRYEVAEDPALALASAGFALRATRPASFENAPLEFAVKRPDGYPVQSLTLDETPFAVVEHRSHLPVAISYPRGSAPLLQQSPTRLRSGVFAPQEREAEAK